MYVQQICLCALFFLARDENNNASAIPEGILTVVLIFFTVSQSSFNFQALFHNADVPGSQVGFQLVINGSYGPLIDALPLSIADKTYKSEDSLEDTNGRKSGDKRRDTVDSAIGASTSHSGPSQPLGPESPAQTQSIIQRTRSSESSLDSKSDGYFDDLHFSRHTDGTVDYGFAHPALARPQRVVWIPDDTLGLGKEEAKANEASGVLATTAGASMNEGGNVEVHAPPVDLNKF